MCFRQRGQEIQNSWQLNRQKMKESKPKPPQRIPRSSSGGVRLFSFPFSNRFSTDTQRHLVQPLTALTHLLSGRNLHLSRRLAKLRTFLSREMAEAVANAWEEAQQAHQHLPKTAKGFRPLDLACAMCYSRIQSGP